MEIFVGADYRGFERKQQLVQFLTEQKHEVIDEGAYEYVEGDDFNTPAVKVAKAVRENRGSLGILVCDSAHGVRAANCDSVEAAKLAREHDDANVLCISAHFVDEKKMVEIVNAFINTPFANLERRVRRINLLDEREDYA